MDSEVDGLGPRVKGFAANVSDDDSRADGWGDASKPPGVCASPQPDWVATPKGNAIVHQPELH